MREIVVNNLLIFIKNSNHKYNDEKLQEIKYGIESLYILITKSIIIFSIAWVLGILNNLLLFVLFYNIIKIPSFGAHAGKSWICLIFSLVLFIGLPFISKIIIIPSEFISLLGIIGITSISIFAPAATIKHPIVNKKRKVLLKYMATLLAIGYAFLALLINNIVIGNTIILALLLQSFIVSPLSYKLFKQPCKARF